MTSEQRGAIEAIIAGIAPAMGDPNTKAQKAAKLDLLEALFLSRPMSRDSARKDATAARANAYADALDDVPSWALAEAIRAYNKGLAGDDEFAPSPGKLRRLALEAVGRVVRARDHLRAVLDAKPLDALLEAQESPEERARVVKGFTSLSDSLRATAARLEAEAREQNRAASARFRQAIEGAKERPAV